MLERQRELERAQGYRGPVTRYLGQIETIGEAGLVMRDMCITLMLLAGVLVASWRWSGVMSIFASVAVAVPALLLLLVRTRAAGVFLLTTVAVTAFVALFVTRVYVLWPLLFWGVVLAAAHRASKAAFKLYEYSIYPGQAPRGGGGA
jgi:hypothetical protein